MTVSTSYVPLSYSGNGSTTSFAITWPFFAASDIVVILVDDAGVETIKTMTTHYAVSGGTTVDGLPSTGSVTMVTAPASGETLRIHRATNKVQSSTWTNAGAFQAKTIEATADRLMLIAQEAGVGGGAGEGSVLTGDALLFDSSGADPNFFDARNEIIRYVADPVDDTDAANKLYVDQCIAATSAGSASTSATSAASSASSASMSASAASAARIAAEAAYDAFDDRYLGAKGSDPLIDNDGDALLDGAIYWSTTLNQMRVYDAGNSQWTNIVTVSSPVQRIASGSSYSYRFGTAFSILDPATYGSWVFDGTDGYPNKLGVTGTKPVVEPGWGSRTADTYTAGTADVASILCGYDNVNNALAGVIASQHSMLAAGADHASIWGGSLHTILDDTDYSTIIGGTNNRIEGRGRYAAIIAGDQCTIETGASDDASGFRSVILGGTGCIAGGRNGTIIASSASEVQSTYGVVLSGENVTLNNGTHMLAAGNGITMGTTAAGTYSVAFGLNIVVNGARASAFGENHVIGSGHDYSSARGSGGVTPFAGAHVFASRHRGAVAGRNQAVDFQCSQETTDTTVTRLSGYGSSGFPTQPDNSIVNGIALVTGVSDAGVCSCFEIDFVSERIGSGTPTLRQNATTVKYDGLALPTDPTMNVTSGGIYRVQVVGLAATNIRWNARVMAEQTVFA